MGGAFGSARTILSDTLHGPRPDRAWVQTDFGAVASYLDTPPQIGVHLLYEGLLLGDTVATSISLSVKLNADPTTGDYHNQRVGAANAVASAAESTTFDAATIAASQAVSGYYSPIFLFFPFFRTPGRQRVCIIGGSAELAATNQVVYLVSHKRHVAGVGALTDPITSVGLSASAGNILGLVRRRVTF